MPLDNAYWYADDETFPVPIQHLADLHGTEIVQVWLAFDCNGELVPDTVEALAPSQAKKARHHSEVLHFVFANVTSFGRRVQDWIWTKGEHILLLQETHLGQKKMEEAQLNNTSTLEDGRRMAFQQNPLAGAVLPEVSLSFMALAISLIKLVPMSRKAMDGRP